ncbi:MAG: maleylpyruvate isomerase family mycothiol-dependent enzyme, partial [Propionibacteriales bacterium]|nr:maleylpyruvate isomerase family mycothiol-dependent enzyme [Propionibacteriales bacterium]
NPRPSPVVLGCIKDTNPDIMSPNAHATPVAQQYQALADGFAAILDEVPSQAWSAQSPCEDWTAGDVVTHVIDTQRDFLAGHGIELSPITSDDPAAAWRQHQSAVASALADPAIGDKEFAGHFGPTTVGQTLVSFYGFDLVAHRWDVAASAGIDLRFADEELATMETSADGWGEALYAEGICKNIDPPAGADRQTRLLARLGRRA